MDAIPRPTDPSDPQADKVQLKDYQKYIDQMRKEFEKSYMVERRQTRIWFDFAVFFAVLGIAVLFVFLLLVIIGLTIRNTLGLLLLKDTAFAVAWLVAGISFIFIGVLIYWQVRKINLPIDNYYLSRIQKAKRLSRSIAFSFEIEANKNTKDQLNELVMQQLLDFLAQGEEIPELSSETSTKK